MSLFDETETAMLHHWVDRMDAGIDRYPLAAFCEWLHGLVARLEETEDRASGLAAATTRLLDVIAEADPIVREHDMDTALEAAADAVKSWNQAAKESP